MGFIGFIALSLLVVWWSSKLNVSIKPKTAQWYLDEAVKLDPSIVYSFRQPERISSAKIRDTTDLDDLSKEELVAIIRKLMKE